MPRVPPLGVLEYLHCGARYHITRQNDKPAGEETVVKHNKDIDLVRAPEKSGPAAFSPTSDLALNMATAGIDEPPPAPATVSIIRTDGGDGEEPLEVAQIKLLTDVAAAAVDSASVSDDGNAFAAFLLARGAATGVQPGDIQTSMKAAMASAPASDGADYAFAVSAPHWRHWPRIAPCVDRHNIGEYVELLSTLRDAPPPTSTN